MATDVNLKYMLSTEEARKAMTLIEQLGTAKLQPSLASRQLWETFVDCGILLCLFTRFGEPGQLYYAVHLRGKSGVQPTLGYQDLLEVLNNYNDN